MSNSFKITTLPLFFLLAFSSFSFSQTGGLTGQLVDKELNRTLSGFEVSLDGTLYSAVSSWNGTFEINNIEAGSYLLTIFDRDIKLKEVAVQIIDGEITDLGAIELELITFDQGRSASNLPIIELDETDFESSDIDVQDYSSLLAASRDLFNARAGFAFGQRRFRVRGYDSEYSTMMFNGIPMNDLENGRVVWGIWGGLNDVMRARTSTVGLEPAEFAFTDIGGGTSIDTRASQQWQQTRISYAFSNRSYHHRLMATHNTGVLPGGWALSLSASRRYAEGGYVEGSFYDAYSYFASLDKIFDNNHTLNLTVFGTPSKRGRSGAGTLETYELSGDNYYNSFWGFQNGEKRNSRVADAHRPTFILRHDWEVINRTQITTAISYQKGRYGTTALDWNNARDPRPDYYRYLPSYTDDLGLAEIIRDEWKNNPAARQIDWDNFYFTNRRSLTSIENANGLEGNTVTGNRSKYILEERRFDPTIFAFNTQFNSVVSRITKLSGGLGYQSLTNESYKLVDDLLGGDFYLDIDRFAERDFSDLDSDRLQSDIRTPNRVATEGDVFGYNYDINVRKANAWIQGEFEFRRMNYFAGAQLTNTSFWRTGYMQNGHFPDNSLGDSEKSNFLNYSAKAGATYKISGRQYLYASANFQTRAPQARNAFLSPRTNHRLNPSLEDEKVLSLEGGYQIRTPFVRGRLTAYYTSFEDQTNLIAFYNDIERAFGFYFLEELNTVHQGIEAALEVKVSPTLSVSGVAALGYYHYSSRPLASQIQDRSEDFIFEKEPIYIENFLVPGTPMTALSLGFSYNSPNFWFINLDFNYFDDLFIDFNPDRRRAAAFDLVEYQSEQWNRIHRQEKTDAAVMVNAFGGKSWRVARGKFIYLNIGVNNLLNAKDVITGGFEQRRYNFRDRDPDTFPNRYYYAQGINFFSSIAYRF
ncbi:MAG: TonB-dependent receptor [Saprospirales bacterium]|nr:MAG: TonB-dependent receptor [Saprospirales bacterium]